MQTKLTLHQSTFHPLSGSRLQGHQHHRPNMSCRTLFTAGQHSSPLGSSTRNRHDKHLSPFISIRPGNYFSSGTAEHGSFKLYVPGQPWDAVKALMEELKILENTVFLKFGKADCWTIIVDLFYSCAKKAGIWFVYVHSTRVNRFTELNTFYFEHPAYSSKNDVID